MADERAILVSSFGKPWVSTTPNVRQGQLNGVLDLTSSEYGLAGGVDLDDVTQPNIIVSENRLRIQFRGEGEGALSFDGDADTGMYSPDDNQIAVTVGGLRKLLIDEDGLHFYDPTSSAAYKSILWEADAWNVECDIHGRDTLGISATTSVAIHIDSDATSTTDGLFMINADGPAYMTSQGILYVREDTRLGMRLPEIDHEYADLAFTDTFFEVIHDHYDGADPGGAIVSGIKNERVTAGEEGGALILRGLLEEDVEVGKNTSARSLVEVWGGKLSSGSLANVAANANVFAVRAYVSGSWTNCIIVDEDGDLYYRGSLTAFDEYDDVGAVSDLYYLMCDDATNVTRYDRTALAEMGAVNETKDGDLMLARKGTTALTLGAIRQLGERQTAVIGDVTELAARVAALEKVAEGA